MQKFDKSIKYLCRICGLMLLEPPWGDDRDSPTFDYCSCGVEFGYQDCQLTAIINYRDKWKNNGARWFEPKYKPKDWSLEDQLKNVPSKYK